MTPYEKSLLTVRFIGAQLDDNGVGIYDLGVTLMSIQRLFNKAYLVEQGRLQKGAFPTKEERERISLQIGERKRKSDAYGLLPALLDPSVQQGIKHLAHAVLTGVVHYYTAKVLDSIKHEKDDTKRIYIGSIHSEITNIVGRIDGSGHIDKIEIGSPAIGEKPLTFTREHKEYLGELAGKDFLGKYGEITGRVFKLYPTSKIVEIRRPGGGKCVVYLNDDDFDAIRYSKKDELKVKFYGRPRYKLGVETRAISEFEVDSIEFLDK